MRTRELLLLLILVGLLAGCELTGSAPGTEAPESMDPPGVNDDGAEASAASGTVAQDATPTGDGSATGSTDSQPRAAAPDATRRRRRSPAPAL